MRRPDEEEGPALCRAQHDDAWLGHMREVHGRLYALVDRLARQQVFGWYFHACGYLGAYLPGKKLEYSTDASGILVLTVIGIRDEYRNQGIGTQLLRHIETHIGRNNVIVVVSDRRSESFFAKNGFEVVEEPRTDARPKPTVIMLKNHEAPLVYRRGG